MGKARQLADLLSGTGDVETEALDNTYNQNSLIVNGAMTISQRGTSQVGVGYNGGYFAAPDRFRFYNPTQAVWTLSQSTEAPEGFAYSYKIDCTTADTTVAADHNVLLEQRFEGQNLQHLKKGTPSAEAVTASFWVRSAKTGTYVLELRDGDNNRSISKSYTIDSADTWEYKTITFEGDTTGTLDNDNANSMTMVWWLAAGSDNASGTLQTSWGTLTAVNQAVGVVNLADSTSNDWHLTGVQLEVGEATPFQHEDYGTTLAKCQRYYQKSTEVGTAVTAVATTGALISRCVGTGWVGMSYLHTAMRDTPTATAYSTRTGASGKVGNLSGATDVTASVGPSENSIYITATMSNAHLGAANWELDAEL